MTSHQPAEPSAATAFAVALLQELVDLGMRDIVIAPGSRSQALALAAAEFERAGLLRLRVRIDERVAGFLALGLSVESGLPVAVVTTSGTAVANLHPAVLEAHHSGVPLIALTADRPPSMRGIGTNQTTVQAGIFGVAVGFEADVVADGSADAVTLARAAWEQRGPSHLNIGFVEPLSTRSRPLGPQKEVPPRGGAAVSAIGAAHHDPRDPRHRRRRGRGRGRTCGGGCA